MEVTKVGVHTGRTDDVVEKNVMKYNQQVSPEWGLTQALVVLKVR